MTSSFRRNSESTRRALRWDPSGVRQFLCHANDEPPVFLFGLSPGRWASAFYWFVMGEAAHFLAVNAGKMQSPYSPRRWHRVGHGARYRSGWHKITRDFALNIRRLHVPIAANPNGMVKQTCGHAILFPGAYDEPFDTDAVLSKDRMRDQIRGPHHLQGQVEERGHSGVRQPVQHRLRGVARKTPMSP